MPSLKEPPRRFQLASNDADVATKLPNFPKRRVWISPQVTSHSAVVLTATKLYVVPGSTPPPVEIVSAVTNGADPGERFGSMVTVVNLGTVRTVTHDLLANCVTLEAKSGNGMMEAWTTRATITFSEAEPADALFAKLWRRLGDDYKLRPDRPPLSKAVQAPLAVLAGILVSTGALASAANAAADYGPASAGWLAPFKSIDWRFVATLGGIAAALVQVWLYRRLTRPPVRLELVKEKS